MTWWRRIRDRKRIYMIPTRFGGAMCFLFLFFTITGAHYSNNLIFLFAFIIVSFLLIAILQTAKNLRGLKVLSVRIAEGFPMEQTTVDILVENGRSLEKFGLAVQFKDQKSHVIIDEIMDNDKKWLAHPYELPHKRGRFSAQRLRISTDAPYGLFYGWYYWTSDAEGVVYPKPAGLLRESTSQNASGADFSGLKSYNPGDLFQRISWKHSAKREDWLVKEFKDETPVSEIYTLEQCPQTDIEGKLSQMALWVTEAEFHQKHYGIVLNCVSSPVGRGEHHLHHCLFELGVYGD